MLRITSLESTDGVAMLKVEGRLANDWVAELSRVVGSAARSSTRITLDVSNVTFVDQEGAALLRALGARGVGLVGCSTFIQALVDRCAD